MLEIILLLAAGLLGWFFTRRQKPTEPPVRPPKKYEPPKFEDKIDDILDEIHAPATDTSTDDELASWLDSNVGRKRK